MGVFGEPVRWWEGTLQARYSAQLRERLGPYAPIFETVPVHPGTAAVALPWRSAAEHRALMERSANLSLVGVLCRDSGAGRVRVDRDGSPGSAGAWPPPTRPAWPRAWPRPGRCWPPPGPARCSASTASGSLPARRPRGAAGLGRGDPPGRVRRRPGHPGLLPPDGLVPHGHRPGQLGHSSDNQTHELLNLFVADASAFPTASGVNPMLSVMALAHRAAGLLAARLA